MAGQKNVLCSSFEDIRDILARIDNKDRASCCQEFASRLLFEPDAYSRLAVVDGWPRTSHVLSLVNIRYFGTCYQKISGLLSDLCICRRRPAWTVSIRKRSCELYIIPASVRGPRGVLMASSRTLFCEPVSKLKPAGVHSVVSEVWRRMTRVAKSVDVPFVFPRPFYFLRI